MIMMIIPMNVDTNKVHASPADLEGDEEFQKEKEELVYGKHAATPNLCSPTSKKVDKATVKCKR